MGENLTTVSKIMCPHGGQAILPTANAQVSTNGSFWLLETDVHIIAGCPFCIGTYYTPCVRIEWTAGSTRTSVNGTPVLKRESIGMCYSPANAIQGTAIIVSTQMKVKTQ